MKTLSKHSHGSKLLCAWMASTGTSYTRLAADLSVNANTVYTWMRGTGRPRVETWKLIEHVTDGAVPALSWTQPTAEMV
jgi:hypothetical protein